MTKNELYKKIEELERRVSALEQREVARGLPTYHPVYLPAQDPQKNTFPPIGDFTITNHTAQ